MARMSKAWGKSKAAVSMVVVQFVSTGLQILSRVILTEGSFVFSLMTYRHLVAALCIAPFAFFLERGKWKKITWVVVFWFLLSALIGIIMAMGMFYYGLKETNATFATNFLNLIPIMTFSFSVILRMERLELDTRRGKVKVGGALLCVGGALTISLYKGHVLLTSPHSNPLETRVTAVLHAAKPNWTAGTLLLVGSCISYAAWFIVQAKLLKAFPFKYWATMSTCIFASIQSAITGVCLDRSPHAWKLQWNLQLITIIYSGILASALTFYLISWTIENKGPSYPPMFNPLGLVFVAATEILFLGANLRLGSLIGMISIVAGIYAFLWGRRGSSKRQQHSMPIHAVGFEDNSSAL
ncbi:hypothetical protein V2J09_011323 [Rumex salicifolius]